MRRMFSILLCISLYFSVPMTVYAEEEATVLEMIEVEPEDNLDESDIPCPYALHIMGVITTIKENSQGKILMGVQVYCKQTMQEITTTFHLQQEISNQWVTIGSFTVTSKDVEHHVKVVSVSNVPSGTFRVKTVNLVRDYNGFAESETGLSPDIYYCNSDL